MAQQSEVPHEVRLRIPQRVEGRSTMASPTQLTPLSTSPTKEWTQITQQKETNAPNHGRQALRTVVPTALPSRENGKEHTACRRFETGGSLDRRVNCRRVPQPRWVDTRRSAKGGGRRRETGVRGGNPAAFVFVPRPGRVRLQ
jgi:hypothetical protein